MTSPLHAVHDFTIERICILSSYLYAIDVLMSHPMEEHLMRSRFNIWQFILTSININAGPNYGVECPTMQKPLQ